MQWLVCLTEVEYANLTYNEAERKVCTPPHLSKQGFFLCALGPGTPELPAEQSVHVHSIGGFVVCVCV